jgi:hypothetical protein
MKKLSLTLLTCLLFLSPNVVLSETLDDLVYRDGNAYKKFSYVPFSGEITGQTKGTSKILMPTKIKYQLIILVN